METISSIQERPRVANEIITQEEANELLIDALDAQQDEPEQLVKLFVILHDNCNDGFLQEALYRMMRAAFNSSLVHSFSLRDYIASIREGRDPLTEARRKWQKEQSKTEGESATKEKRRKSKRKKP